MVLNPIILSNAVCFLYVFCMYVCIFGMLPLKEDLSWIVLSFLEVFLQFLLNGEKFIEAEVINVKENVK